MSVKTKLARQAVATTAKYTTRRTAAKAARKPFRSITLLTVGALIGLVIGWLLANNNATEKASGTGAVS